MSAWRLQGRRFAAMFFAMSFGLSWGIAAILVLFSERMEMLFGPLGYTNLMPQMVIGQPHPLDELQGARR